ncbi:MAG: flagellar hook-length control protein FliK [Bacillus sp. (in: Bacteria)]|nr:flagellar hook-length control protein FliK [Bacillus sp. (in: firmicutes)]MCM1425992.1 flagellar hook-length control protein FliK [Eubacterium sp.]
MAGIPVNNNLKALANAVSPAVSAPNQNASYTKQEEALQDSFDTVMSRVNGSQTQQTAAKADAQGNGKTVAKVATVVDTKSMTAGVTGADSSGKDTAKTAASEKASVKSGSKDNTVAKDDSAKPKVSDETQDAVEKAGEELVNDVAEEMGVSPEEVEEAMETLGLTAVQLLDPANMKQLLMTLSGSEDQLSIVTDAELYGHLQNLLDSVSTALDGLQSELGLSEEELSALLADMAVVQQPEEVEVPKELTAEPETDDVNLEGMKDYAVTVHRDGETVEVKVTVDDAGGEKSVQQEVTATPETQTKHDAKSGNRNAFSQHKGEGNAADNLMMQAPAQQTQTQEVSAPQPVMERFVSTEDIMNQIMEYMKINLKGDVQELELQLHPASLGNVHVQIASKDGMVSAQFTAQNEVVKAAIESQLVQLKTQFEEQGIKVDAVEVTVANYRFEQNFSGNEEHPGEKQGNGKKNRKNINLNELDLDDMAEDMDDSERIAAEMMASSGNTVDYTA